MKTLFERLYDASRINPDKLAIWCDGEELSYKDFFSLTCRYSNYLKNHGVKRGEIIGIPMTNCIESVSLIFAASSIGAGLAPINPTLPVDAIETAFNSADVMHIIARKAFYTSAGREWLDSYNGVKLCLDEKLAGLDSFDEVLNASDEIPDCFDITGDEPLIMTMTSGSTGNPKPIVLTQNNKIKRADAHIGLYKLTKDDNILAATPLYHSLAERLVIMPLLIGGTSVLLPRFTPIIWLNCVNDQNVTFTIAVSAQLAQITQLLSSPYVPEISSLRCIVSSSALLEPHVRSELISKLRCEFHEMYGTSECSTVTDIYFKDAENKVNSVGYPLEGVKIRIVDNNDRVLQPGQIGEIVVDTPLRCEGYYKLPDIMDTAMCDGFFRTGDLGKLDEDGYLYFCGRKKELIITGGVNVYPMDVEEKILRMEAVKECAAFAFSDERLGEVVAVAIVPSSGELTKKKVQLYCARNLADFQQPHKIFFLDELPKNSMGKLVKSRLPEVVAGMEG